jgi:hypothetical protein
MDVFSLRDNVVGEYKKFATSFTTIFASDIRTQIDAIYADARYWPEPLIQVNPNFKRVTTDSGVMTTTTAFVLTPCPGTRHSPRVTYCPPHSYGGYRT